MIKHTKPAGLRRQRTLAKVCCYQVFNGSSTERGGANSGLRSRLFSTRIWTAKLVETVGDLTLVKSTQFQVVQRLMDDDGESFTMPFSNNLLTQTLRG